MAPDPDPDEHVDEEVDAGPFGVWLDAMGTALDGAADADVPCGGCVACCTSAQFVHVGAEETETLAAIPAALLVPAPGGAPGDRVMGYDERGRCPMLVDGACSIYRQRPRACRTYDCRVFAAAGLDPAADDKPLVAERVRRWRFSHPAPADRELHDAVAATARELTGPNVTARSVRAVRVVIGRRRP